MKATLHALVAQAIDAKFLPPRYADEFVRRITEAADTASQFGGTGPEVPADWSPSVAEKVRELATDAFALGFTTATRTTLVLPVVVLVLGMIAAAGLRAPATGNAKNRGLPRARTTP